MKKAAQFMQMPNPAFDLQAMTEMLIRSSCDCVSHSREQIEEVRRRLDLTARAIDRTLELIQKTDRLLESVRGVWSKRSDR
jgi:hypothetical protein